MTPALELLNDRYRLDRILGRGGMSDVFEAVDESSAGTKVAVKIVRSADPEFARRLAQEAKTLERFEHPGLVRLLDAGVRGSDAFLVMELVEGPNLAEILRLGARSPEETAALGSMLADALAYVHERGVVHRDVKPANVLLTPQGMPKLGDFGIARLMDSSALTVTGTILGTASYMAPEQLENHQVGPAADIWSLGIVLLECLTGHRVYEGTPSEVVGRRLAGPVPVPADLPVPWTLLLNGMLDHEPGRRLRAAEVASLLTTEAFTAPWDPSKVVTTDLLVPVEPHDLTALVRAPGVGVTAVVPHDGTMVGPPIVQPPTPDRRGRPSARTLAVVVGLIAVAIVVTVFVASNGGTHGGAPARTTAPSTTSVPTTAAPTSADALANLQRDVSAGVSAGAIRSGVAQTIVDQANQATSAVAAGKPDQAVNSLAAAATAIASLSPNEASTLQSDLTSLAGILGLNAAAVPSTTTAPGHGKGKGH